MNGWYFQNQHRNTVYISVLNFFILPFFVITCIRSGSTTIQSRLFTTVLKELAIYHTFLPREFNLQKDFGLILNFGLNPRTKIKKKIMQPTWGSTPDKRWLSECTKIIKIGRLHDWSGLENNSFASLLIDQDTIPLSTYNTHYRRRKR